MVQHTPPILVGLALLVLLFTAVVVLSRSSRKAFSVLLGGALAVLIIFLLPAMFLAGIRPASRQAVIVGDAPNERLARSLARLDRLDERFHARPNAVIKHHPQERVIITHGNGHVTIKTSQTDERSSEQQDEVQASPAAAAAADDRIARPTAASSQVASEGNAPSASATSAFGGIADTDKKRLIDDPFTPEVDQEWNPGVETREQSDAESSAHSESIEPQPEIDPGLPTNKPDWIYESLSTSQEPHRLTVRCGPFASQEQIALHEDEALQEGALRYAEWYLQTNGKRVHNFGDLLRLQIPLERLHECVADTYDEVHLSDMTDVDPMPIRYVLLEFDSDFRRQVIDVYWHQSMSVARSLQAGLGGVGVVALLGVILGAVRIDALTKGQHRGKVIAMSGLIATAALLTFSACGIYFLRS